MDWTRAVRWLTLAGCALSGGWSAARAQSIEPRYFSPAPVGVNFLVGGYVATQGALSFGDQVPLTDARIKTSGPVLSYVRSVDLLGKSAKLDVILPYGRLSGSAIYQGAPVQREVSGWEDPLVRLSVILYGAPAMNAAQFRGYKQDLLVGAAVQVSVPLGQYDTTRLVNLGAHRWYVRPQIGVSKTVGPWVFELVGSAVFYSTDDRFLVDNRLAQRPVYAAEGHLIYRFHSGVWTSADATYFTGGATSLNAAPPIQLQRNWRAGATLGLPVNRSNSIKLYASRGVSARTGNNYNLFGVTWQYRWGGGL